MKVLKYSILIMLFLSVQLSAVTYLKFIVNGTESDSLVQGDLFAWELDVETPGNLVRVDFYYDLDSSMTITPQDKVLDIFFIQDGEGGGDGPGDSSSVADGLIYVNFGPFGFAPGYYVLQMTDMDQSSVSGHFKIIEMPNPVAVIKGRVKIEGKTYPDPLYRNIMVGAMGNGMFSGLTDENGYYYFNMNTAGDYWEIGPFLSNPVPGYLIPEQEEIFVQPGITDSVNFIFSAPNAWVYGSVKDQDGMIVSRTMNIWLENESYDGESGMTTTDGNYSLSALVVYENENDFELNVQGEYLIPDYMQPQENEFSLATGDSIQQDITVFQTNENIFVYVTESGGLPSRNYFIICAHDSFGYSYGVSDPQSGYAEIPVRDGVQYQIGIETSPEWGTPLPHGFIISGGNYRAVMPGDTVYFDLVPAGNMLSGQIYTDPDDPIFIDPYDSQIMAWDTSWTSFYYANPDTALKYELFVPDGTWNIRFNPDDESYLVIPDQYPNVVVQQDTIDSLIFIANYAHANLTIKLIDAPLPMWFDGFGISTLGAYPFIYYTWSNLYQPDSSLFFRICEGDWFIPAPFLDPGYTVYPEDTILTVTENDSGFYLEFVYKQTTVNISDNILIPDKYYLSQNYPNPFNPVTTIQYGLPEAAQVKIAIYNIRGQRINTLVDEYKKAGHHRVKWDSDRLSSGIYFYKIETDKFESVRKAIFIK